MQIAPTGQFIAASIQLSSFPQTLFISGIAEFWYISKTSGLIVEQAPQPMHLFDTLTHINSPVF